MDTLVETDTREEGGDASAKDENLSKLSLSKGLLPKGLSSSRFLPKGTKTKVNLDEQGRQKVSFSFSLTKKPLQNRFLAPPSPEKPSSESQIAALMTATSPPQDRAGQPQDSRSERAESPPPAAEPQATSPVISSPPKPKLDLGKMHFKKHLLSVTAKYEMAAAEGGEEKRQLPPAPSAALDEPSGPEPEPELAPAATAEATEPQPPQCQNAVTKSGESVMEGKDGLCQQSPADTSHIGKEDNLVESLRNAQHPESAEPGAGHLQLESALPGSESDGDSVQTSSSHKSGDPRSSVAQAESQSKEAKSSSSVSKAEESEKSSSSSSRSRSEKDDRHSGYSKLESRHTSSRSTRTDRDRRRNSRSRSRSRSRGSRTNSSYARSERSLRSERSSRSERSHYHDSDRRSHRSSPHRERSRASRCRSDRRSRDSSDSEDERRRTRSRGSDSKRTSTYSTSHRDSKTTSSSSTYSKSDKDSKTAELPRSSETEKSTRSHSRPDRDSRRTVESPSVRRSSPEAELDRRKSGSHSKSEGTVNSTHSKPTTRSQTSDKQTRRATSSSDSEEEQQGLYQSHALDRSSSALRSDETRAASTGKMDKVDVKQSSASKPSVHQKPEQGTTRLAQDTERPSQIKLNLMEMLPSQINCDKPDPQSEHGGERKEMHCLANTIDLFKMDSDSCSQAAIPNIKDFQNLIVPEPDPTKPLAAQDSEQNNPPDRTKSSKTVKTLNYSLRSQSKLQKLDSSIKQEVANPSCDSRPVCQPSPAPGTIGALSKYCDSDRNTEAPEALTPSEPSGGRQQEGPDCPDNDLDSPVPHHCTVDGRERTAAAPCGPPFDSGSPAICSKLPGSLKSAPVSVVPSGDMYAENGAGVVKASTWDEASSNDVSNQMEEDMEIEDDFSTTEEKPCMEDGCSVEAVMFAESVSERLLPESTEHSSQQVQLFFDRVSVQERTPLVNCNAFPNDKTTSSIEPLLAMDQGLPCTTQFPNEEVKCLLECHPTQLPQPNIVTEELGQHETYGSHEDTAPPKEESLFKEGTYTMKDVQPNVTEQIGNKVAQQKDEPISQNSKSNMKKSRWDIVGQETSDQENSPKCPSLESRPQVKKVVSVRRIQLSKEQISDTKEMCIKVEPIHKQGGGSVTSTHSSEEDCLLETRPVSSVETEQKVRLGDNSPIRTQADLSERMFKPEPLSVPAQPSSQARVDMEEEDNVERGPGCNSVSDPWESRPSSAGVVDREREGARDGDGRGQVSLKDKPDSSSVSSEGEDSDTEESDSDSDDGSIPRKRLQSVVVVPKNSSLTLENRALLSPSPSPSRSPGPPPADWVDHSWNEPSGRGEGARREMGRSHSVSPEERRRVRTQLLESGERTGEALTVEKTSFLVSQSNTVDSTSQLEAVRTRGTQHSMELTHPHPHGLDKPKNPGTLEPAVPTFLPQNSWGEPDPVDQRHYERPDSWQGRKWGKRLSQYHRGDFSDMDGFGSRDSYSLAWDYTQSEQPSSTYQQPDSSHGLHLDSTYQQHPQQFPPTLPQGGNPPTGQPCWQGNGYWVPPVYLPVPTQYQEPVCQVHPDSLTNDYEDDGRGKAVSSQTGLLNSIVAVTPCEPPPPPPPSSFLQAHEISSNCKGPVSAAPESTAAPDLGQDDSRKPHRGRGPPKKRRHKLESDSENEAELGASKKERLGEADTVGTTPAPTEAADHIPEAHRPLLSLQDFQDPYNWKDRSKYGKMPPYFDLIEENMYLTERKKSKSHRDIKRMQCECAVLTKEERMQGAMACGEDCLNRLLMIECSSRCPNGAYCSNRRFQRKQHADFEVILTESKGWGLRAARDLTPNTFVLEYCGEVLDHKEFKTRVKEYARSKNIHYYFMALKNNEIIDATLKGNCSRFMNHSCEPNCETQKWTVNGQLRVGFFTTKAVPAGTELTFDYQFQRYGKEAQKCFCGAPSCRGFLGGENRVSIRAAGGKMKKERTRKKDSVDEELEALLENGDGLSDEKQVVSLCRLMVRVETMEQKLTCLKLIQNTQNPACLKQFLDHHGLSLLWIFMVELSEGKGNSSNNIKLQLEIMKSLSVLPISTKNMLEESRVLHFIQRWAQSKTLPPAVELDGYSSENTSRAQTPLNTPDGPPSKPGPELDSDTPKRAVYRRLKIISENSMDSALSDASKASDGKEDEEEEEEEEEEEAEADSSQADPAESSQPRLEPTGEPQAEGDGQVGIERPETQESSEPPEVSDGTQAGTESQEAGVAVAEVPEGGVQHSQVEGASEEPKSDSQVSPLEDGLPPSMEDPDKTEEMSAHSLPPAPDDETMVVELTPAEETVATEVVTTAETIVPETIGAAETVAVETPSQDEEEGVSDVESERSQEPPHKVVDISDMASRLLDSWKDLKEVYRIPKKSQVEKEPAERSRDGPNSRDPPLTPRTPSGSRERDRDRERDRERDRDRDRDRDRERTPRSAERRRRRSSLSPPSSAYESSRRRSDDRYDPPSSSKKKGRTKERNKLSTEERRKLFEQEVAQREAQKQQQLHTLAVGSPMTYDPLGYASSPHPSFMGYPPGYPIQTYVDPTNPNAGKVLLPTPPVEPMCGTLPYEQTPPQPQTLLPEPGLTSPSPTSQPPPVSAVQHVPAPLEVPSTPQYVQPSMPQDPALALLSVPPQVPSPQVQAPQSYALWDPSTQQALAVQAPPQPYQSAQPQTAIYYPGQPCQAVYSITTPYPQASTPVIQSYAQPVASFLQGQQVYGSHQQGMVVQQEGAVTTIVTAQPVQQELMVSNSLMDLPPPSPPKPKTIVLPVNWKAARDPEGKIYYYHIITRQTQWDPPCWEGGSDDASVDHEAEMDLGTPTYDENPTKFSTKAKTAEADTSSELAKRSKEVFRKEMSQFIVQCLNPYRKPDCKLGRISNTEDFKHLARKLTHGVMNKELKSCKNPEDLECNENVKHKTKEYIKKYMQKFGSVYRPKEDTEVD
ncbi:histone-lysine N-methyltransferase SETD2 [Amia ocellicauda]|uniref:histone-lysine N-methyltransferase SETD2 n=1 Tax=Amia ocellicauda TaxID=2972642 RepID=UPI003463CB3C